MHGDQAAPSALDVELAQKGGPPSGEMGSGHPPPRLPSISALLNTPDPQSRDLRAHSPPCLPHFVSFDGPAPAPYRQAGGDALAGSSGVPLHPTSGSPSRYAPVAPTSMGTAAKAGLGISQTQRVVRPPSPPPRALTSLDFPDGNTLRVLPSGQSSANDARPRAASISHPPYFDASAYTRLPGFATSSERRGSGAEPDEPQEARRGFNDVLSGAAHLEALRPRALSTSSTDEYRAQKGWSAITPPYQYPNLARPESSTYPGRPVTADVPVTAQHYAVFPPSYRVDAHRVDYHANEQRAFQHPHASDAWPPRLPSYPPQPFHLAEPTQRHDLHLAIPSGLPHAGALSPPYAAAPQYASQSVDAAGPSAWPAQTPAPGPLSAPATTEPSQEAGRYGCPHCPKRFARPSSLRIHMHSHTGEKPFTCPMCDRAFSVQSNLRRHLKIHKGGSGPASGSEQVASTSRGLPPPAGEEDDVVDAAARPPSADGSKSASTGGTDASPNEHTIEEEDAAMLDAAPQTSGAAVNAPADGVPLGRMASPRARERPS